MLMRGERIVRARGPHDDVVAVAWSPTDYHLATGSSDNMAALWSAASARIHVLGGPLTPGAVTVVVWSPDG
jgi:WD40 repeat protein